MARVKDIPIGTRFGNLVIVSFAGIARRFHASWNCLCDCGKETVVLGTHLRRGKTRSCGHLFTTAGRRASNFKDLTNQRFNHWFVIKFSRIIIRPNGKKSSLWLCRCDCGVEKEVIGGQLVFGSSSQCKRCPRMKPPGVSSRNTVFAMYKNAASERGYSWSLSSEYFDEITKQNCFYCAQQPSNKNKSGNGPFIYSGIDRVDNSCGYEVNNVVPCCRRCNRAKDVMTQEEFISWATRVVQHMRIK